mgnify:CR=1 FL=1
MKENLRYILFHLLLSIRRIKLCRIVKFICKFFIIISILAVISMKITDMPQSPMIYIIVAIISWLIMIYYDKLLFKIKPDDMDLYLS